MKTFKIIYLLFTKLSELFSGKAKQVPETETSSSDTAQGDFSESDKKEEKAFHGCDNLTRSENNLKEKEDEDEEEKDDDDYIDDIDEYDEEHLNKLKELGENGNAKAQDELGFYYWMNEEPEDAFYWYQKSVQQKYPQGMADLGRCYAGVFEDYEVDHEKAIQLLTEAAELGCADGYFGLSECYTEGYGVEKNMKKAKELYAKAVELGCNYDEPWLEDD